MRKIKIAQIGTSKNSHGSDIFETLTKQTDIFEIIGYAFAENEKEKFPERLKPFDGYKEMTVEEILEHPQIEAVTIETEEVFLTKYAALAAQHKKHIHMEKPGGTNLLDFEKLIETVRKNNTVFHTGYMYRYNPYVIDLKKQIKNGELGEIISVEAQMNCIESEEIRQWLKTFQGGMMFFLGGHLIDLILQIQGEPENIIPCNKCSRLGDSLGEDFGMAVFEYKNGVSFAKTSAVEIGGYSRRQLVVAGSKKTVELKPLEICKPGGMFTKKTEYASEDWNNAGITTECDVFGRYDSMMKAFAGLVRGETKNPYTYDYELMLYKTILKACGVLN